MSHVRGSAREGRRILLVCASLSSGGAERQLSELANYWSARGIRVTVATYSASASPDFYQLHPAVRRVHLADASRDLGRSALGLLLARVRDLRRLIRVERPDAVLSFITETNVITLLASLGGGTRIVVSERAHPAHDTSVRPVWRWLRRATYGRAACVAVQTKAAGNWVRERWRVDTRVIPNLLRELPSVDVRRESLILAVGRLQPQKGFDLLLRAFARLQGDFPEWSVTILGEGPERHALQALCTELGVTQRVHMPGVSGQVEDWMARAGLVVQPSRFEGFPNVVMEAMGLGAPVISADCPAGPADLIEDGINGRLVPVEDVAALENVMRELMGDPVARDRIGASARQVRSRFNADRIMAKWEEALFDGTGAQ